MSLTLQRAEAQGKEKLPEKDKRMARYLPCQSLSVHCSLLRDADAMRQKQQAADAKKQEGQETK
jgi:hypothetical protein